MKVESDLRDLDVLPDIDDAGEAVDPLDHHDVAVAYPLRAVQSIDHGLPPGPIAAKISAYWLNVSRMVATIDRFVSNEFTG